MDSNVQFGCRLATVRGFVRVGAIYRRTVIRAVASLGEPIELSDGVRGHLYQAEALVRALRDAGNNAVNYFIATAGHSSFEPETDTRLRTIMNELPPMTSPEMASLQ